jgi:pyruvate formate lyase activating enzyme
MSAGGIVFDIQRGSLHDGPGIRTTVFFKGCHLRCRWCHNPESLEFEPEFSFNREKCTACGRCAAVCPEGVHDLADGVHAVAFEKCSLCGLCLAVCPASCLSIVGREYSTDELMATIVRDRAFYESSGGGLTLSGGEPTAQPDFLGELLAASKAEGIATCIETAGAAAEAQLRRLLPLVDLFLFDWKDSDPARHERNTGIGLNGIRSNLEFLYANGAAIILRCPIIPGVNDTDEHFRAIVEMERGHADIIRTELMPYHDMGAYKAGSIGSHRRPLVLRSVEKEASSEWLARISDLGGERIVLG